MRAVSSRRSPPVDSPSLSMYMLIYCNFETRHYGVIFCIICNSGHLICYSDIIMSYSDNPIIHMTMRSKQNSIINSHMLVSRPHTIVSVYKPLIKNVTNHSFRYITLENRKSKFPLSSRGIVRPIQKIGQQFSVGYLAQNYSV